MEANRETKAMEVDYDGIMMSLGKVGKYQMKHFLWIIIPVVLHSIQLNNFIFTAMDTKYRCFIEGCDTPGGELEPPWLSMAIPKDKNNNYKKCHMYQRIETNISTVSDSCNLQFDETEVKCDKYLFEKSDTFIQEMDIPCENFKLRFIGTLHSTGTLLALPLIGFLSDRYGRKFMLVIAAILNGTLGVIKGFSPNYAMFAAFELLEPTLGYGVFTSIYVLTLELLQPSTRVAGGAVVNTMLAIGQVCLGLIAWGLPYYRTFIYVIYAPSILIFTYWWILDESTRWLLSKGKYAEALKIITKIAKTNKTELPEKQLEPLRYNIEQKYQINKNTTKKETENKTDEKSPFQQAIRSKTLLLRVLKCSFWWFTCTLCFYGISINSVSLSDKNYMNFILSALVEVPGDISGYFFLTYLGRKKTIFGAYFFTGVCLISFIFIPSNLSWLAQTFYFIGKFCITVAFDGIYLYTSELFPTPVRLSMLAACSMVGRLGSITAPLTPLLKHYLDALPAILFTSTCLISALLMLTSPETLGRKLPETIKEAENLTTKNQNEDDIK